MFSVQKLSNILGKEKENPEKNIRRHLLKGRPRMQTSDPGHSEEMKI